MPMIGKGAIPISPDAAGYEPSTMSTLGQFLFGNDGSWADSKEHLRQLSYQQAMRPIQAQAMQQWASRFLGGGAQPASAPAQSAAPEPAAVDPNDLQGMMAAGLGRAVAPAVPQMSQASTAPPQTQVVPQTQRRRGIVDINNPDDQAMIVGGKVFGMPGADTIMDIAKATQPDIQYDRGFGYDKKTGASTGNFHPDLDKGQVPLYDENRNLVAVRNIDGSIQSAADMARAVTGAQEGARADWDVGTYNTPDGATVQMPRGAFVRGYNGQPGGPPAAGPLPAQVGGRPGALQPGVGTSQTPQARAAAESAGHAEGEAGAKARIDLPAVQQRANTSVALIDSLIRDPHLDDALGWSSKLPALPGSKRVGVEAKLDQLGGTTFLQAYNELKGAGAITEIEGAKAESAIARLNRRDQSPADYRAALMDLRSVIVSGVGRAHGRSQLGQTGGGQGQRAVPKAGDVQQGYRFNGGNPADPKSWSRI